MVDECGTSKLEKGQLQPSLSTAIIEHTAVEKNHHAAVWFSNSETSLHKQR